MRHLPKALLLALLVGTPAMAQTRTWENWRDEMLTWNRSRMMEFCEKGRRMNANGKGWFSREFNEIRRETARQNGFKMADLEAFMSGSAAAMAIACPTVW